MNAQHQWRQSAIQPAYARLLCALMRSRGVDPPTLLAGTGITWADLIKETRPLSFDVIRALFLAAARHSGAPHLGLELGDLAQASAHGPVGYAALASADLAQAVDVLGRYASLRSPALDFRVVNDGEHTTLFVRERFDFGEIRVPVLETTLLILVRLIERVSGASLDRVEFRLPWPAPEDSREYTRRFAGSIRFDATSLQIRLPDELLRAPCPTADPAGYASACRDCEIAIADQLSDTRFADQVRLRLIGREGDFSTCEEMAEEFHVSARTLIRKLKDEGTSYQELLDDVRKDLARWYLENTRYPVEEIAARVGYADTSNFSRTFRRWFGVTPRELRLSAASASPGDAGIA